MAGAGGWAGATALVRPQRHRPPYQSGGSRPPAHLATALLEAVAATSCILLAVRSYLNLRGKQRWVRFERRQRQS